MCRVRRHMRKLRGGPGERAGVCVGKGFAETLSMKAAEILQPRRDRRDADCAAEIAHQVEQAGCVAQLFRRLTVQRETNGRTNAEKKGEPAQTLRHEKFPKTPIRRYPRH